MFVCGVCGVHISGNKRFSCPQFFPDKYKKCTYMEAITVACEAILRLVYLRS